MIWTDKRAKLLQELLGGMRVLKFFAWYVLDLRSVWSVMWLTFDVLDDRENPYLERIATFRNNELKFV